MKVEYLESGRVKTIIGVKEVTFKDGHCKIIPKRGKTKEKTTDSLLAIIHTNGED